MSPTAAVIAALCCSIVAGSDSPREVIENTAPAALERRVDAFVRAITANPGVSDRDSLVRWNSPICVLVAGLRADDVKLASARLSQISLSSGAPLARAPCPPNFIVVATSEPDRVLNAWYARDTRLFGDAPSAQIRQFRERSKSRPVSVWYNIDPGRKSGTRNGHFIPSNTQAESSAFAGNAAVGFLSVLVVIHTRRTEHTTPNQWADYAAMAGLSRVDPDAALGSAPSILRLFAAPVENQPAGLSSWDAAFLKALYQSNQTSRTQRFDIAERVTRELSR